ncbi:hypothetical protein LAUMK40_05973 [Mycobacterium kansasii]|jgi:hypothetical protein|uniref:hypothetical protein n=1 Tax=Mycobacterium kansasii TaxID=1768 RepID=UPI000F01F2C6|nr:hypothetical protein [Mycobacterium kansasii]VAZ69810.1 hypothetical protein LAUMK40_05973 [Mycobacterium kansasii]
MSILDVPVVFLSQHHTALLLVPVMAAMIWIWIKRRNVRWVFVAGCATAAVLQFVILPASSTQPDSPGQQTYGTR